MMEDMRRRIDAGDGEAEKRTAIEVCDSYMCLFAVVLMWGGIQAMRDIAFDRAGKLGVL